MTRCFNTDGETKWCKGCMEQGFCIFESRDESQAAKKMEAYAIALQRAIEYHCKGLEVPKAIRAQCPWHAGKLDTALHYQLEAKHNGRLEGLQIAQEIIKGKTV
jgi:hypothetical protein